MNESTAKQEEKPDEKEKEEMLDYFFEVLFYALGSYTGWKTIAGAKRPDLVSEETARGYAEIQNLHKGFFISAQKAFCAHFTLFLCHFFDENQRAYSFHTMKGIDKEKVDQFCKENKEALKFMREHRNKIFAHKDKNSPNFSYNDKKIFELFDLFFKNLIKFYKEIARRIFSLSNAEVVKYELEKIFEDIYRANPSLQDKISTQQWENREKISENLSCID